ncbi:uncharacterized protein LOC120353488 [Nilaparvata lugens]|uniref:uncharacterized protein LOC120353488 n=1 Tax=Nilaparvata lugens TaxID=108931 RepID=UPI00193C9D56|nr:uncharacterized protein LOC120353488 [Nilaparvata lugens]
MESPLLVSVTGEVQPLIVELNWLENRNDTEQRTFVWKSIGEHSTSPRLSEDSSCQIPEALTNSTFDYRIGNLEINNVLNIDKFEDDSNSAINAYCYKLPSFNMKNKFYSIKKIVIELDSCQIAKKVVIQMENRTDASVSYSTDILNFHPNEEPISKQNVPDEHDYKRWKSMIQPDMGVVVCVQNPSGKLTNNDGATELSIWAFATSWGVYRDVLTIEGDGQLPPVSFQLEIICTSNPISFPAFCKPVLR